MPTKLSEIPQQQAITLIREATIELLDNLIKTLDFEIIKLKGIKQELLKLK